MNIFYLDENIEKCAQYHCDKHVVKMCLEYAQLLSSAHHVCGTPSGYALTHKNHPCAIWTRESQDNYEWLLEMALALGEEYTYRYGKYHKSLWVVYHLPSISLPKLGITKRPICAPDNIKNNFTDPIEAYRMYYCTDKARFCTWKGREVPDWFENIGLI